jgi:hypothetical protein
MAVVEMMMSELGTLVHYLAIDYVVSSIDTATTLRRYAATNDLQDTIYYKCSSTV